MAEQTPERPRPRALLVLAVLTAVALCGVAPFTEPEAATTQATEDRTGWYDIVRATVAIFMDSGWVVRGEPSHPRDGGRKPAAGDPGRAVIRAISSWPAKHC